MSLDWSNGALCAQTDPHLWFPEKGDWANSRRAKKVCATCPLKAPCLRAAMDDPSLSGIWGGTTWMERINIRAWRPDDTRETRAAKAALNRAAARAQELARTEAAALGEMPAGEHVGED